MEFNSAFKGLKGSYKPKTNVNRRSTTSFIARFSQTLTQPYLIKTNANDNC